MQIYRKTIKRSFEQEKAKYVPKPKRTFVQAFREARKLKTVKELLYFIPDEGVERVAFFLLAFLCSIPVWAGFTYKIMESEFILEGIYTSSWFASIFTVGGLGLLVLVFVCVKGVYHYQDRKRATSATVQTAPYLRRMSFVESLLNEQTRQWYLEKGLLLCFVGFFIWAIFSCLASTNLDISFYGTQTRREGLLAYIMYVGIFALALVIKRERMMKLVLEALVGFASIIGIIQIINLDVIYKFMKIDVMSGTFFNSNHYGYYLCIAILASVTLLMSKGKVRGGILSYAHIVELAVLSNAMVLCQSLGPLLGVVGGLVLFTVFVWIFHKDYIKRICAIDLMVLSVLFVFNTGYWSMSSEYSRLLSDLRALANGGDTGGIGSGRGKLWKYGVEFIKQRPLFGYGLDNLGQMYKKVGCVNDRAHNEIIQFAASMGIPAALLYLGGLSCHLRNFIVRMKDISLLQLGLYVTVGGYLISSLFGNTMFYTTPYFLVVLALSYSSISSHS